MSNVEEITEGAFVGVHRLGPRKQAAKLHALNAALCRRLVTELLLAGAHAGLEKIRVLAHSSQPIIAITITVDVTIMAMPQRT